MGATVSSPLEDLFGDPLGASLWARTFGEGRVQRQIDDALQIPFAPGGREQPGGFGESGTDRITKVRGMNSVERRQQAG